MSGFWGVMKNQTGAKVFEGMCGADTGTHGKAFSVSVPLCPLHVLQECKTYYNMFSLSGLQTQHEWAAGVLL